MIDVAEYWENRYRKGGESGAGSRGAEADDKVSLVNAIVSANGVRSILDLGAGDGYVARGIEVESYTGYDPSLSALKLLRQARPDAILTNRLPCRCERFDLVLSMDVLFHLVTPEVYADYLDALFGYSDLVLVYGTDRSEAGRAHVLHREWTKDVPDGWTRTEIPVAYKRAWLLRRDP